MQELTQVEFMNALDGQAVAIAWHHSFSSHNKTFVDEVAFRWFNNIDDFFEDVEAWSCYHVTKENSHMLRFGTYRSNFLSVHGFKFYRTKAGYLYIYKVSSCYTGSRHHHTVEAYLFAVNP